ncbi:MAG: BamA/TamA family outer membrane protein [Ignavibacteriaceae bacterium]
MDNQREEFNVGLGATYVKKNFFGDARKLTFNAKGEILSFILEGASSETNFKVSQYLNPVNVANINTTERALFYKLQGTSAFYLPISNDNNATFAIKFKSGYIQTIEGGYNIIPPNRTFFAGGSNSVRGWRARELVLHNSIHYFGLTLSDTLRGGTFLLEGSFEFRTIGEAF